MIQGVAANDQDFDGIPPYQLHKLSKKQDETTRSLEKIEKGPLTDALQTMQPSLPVSLLFSSATPDRVCGSPGYLAPDGK
jgi:hypothetical protein